jgi:D-amino peptidase
MEPVKILLVCDMEGIAGISDLEQISGAPQPGVTGDTEAYHAGRRLYTEDVNAAVRGARAAGATDVVVVDGHGAGGPYTYNSIIPAELDGGCEFVVQEHWWEYTEPLEQGCRAVLFIGMHAMAGTPDGVLNHTVSWSGWRTFRLNGHEAGEIELNATICGEYGAAVALVTGDRAACAEARGVLGDQLRTVETKEGLGREAANLRPPSEVQAEIEAAAREAVAAAMSLTPYRLTTPVEITVDLPDPEFLHWWNGKPGITIEGRRVISRADDWRTAWRQFAQW